MKKRLMSIMLSLTMVASLFSGMTVTASAADEKHNEISNEHNCEGYTPVATLSSPIAEGSYSLKNDISIIAGTVKVNSGIVNLCLHGNILAADLTVASGATLNIYDCGSATHIYKSSATGAWVLDENGDETIKGGVITGKIKVDGTLNLCGGTLCGVSGGIAIHNKAKTTIGKDVAVMGNYNGASDSNAAAVVLNDKKAEFYNYGHIDQNVSRLHTVRNNGGAFYNHGSISSNYTTTKDDGLAAGGVANYSLDTASLSEFYNYKSGQVNDNNSERSSGGVLNKVGAFYNYGQINDNTAARHCGGVDNTSKDSNGNSDTNNTFIKNYGQINGNKALGVHNGTEGGTGGGIYNEEKAKIYNYGEICRNEAKVSGAGIYFNNDGALYVGGNSRVTGNTVGSNVSNILLGSGKVIQMDVGEPLTTEAYMGVHLTTSKSNGYVTSGYGTAYSGAAAETYFFPDADEQLVMMKNNEVYLEKKTITVAIADWAFGDAASEPVVKTIAGVFVAVGSGNCFYKGASEDEYSNTVPTAVGEYTLKVTVNGNTGFATFKIVPKEIVPAVTLEYEEAKYQGVELEPAVTVKYGDAELPSDAYTVAYADNDAVGTATVTITAKAGGNYTFDTITKTFEIVSGDSDDNNDNNNNNNSSSSGNKGSSKHKISSPSAENGEVTINRKQASKGTEVTITVTPDEGYELGRLTVTDRKGNELELTDKGDGKYTFKMPSGKVTIDANFVEVSSAKEESDVEDCSKDETCPVDAFIDASAAEWYHNGVHYCIENDLMSGIDENIFAPNNTTTRAMVITMLWRLEGKPMVAIAEGFNDVYETDWYNDAIRWATVNGIAKGYGDGYFGPSDTVTREQMVSILWNYAQYKGFDMSEGENTNILSYNDAFDISEYAVPAMQWACGFDVVNGMEDLNGNMILDPQGGTTRAQMATMMMRFCGEV